MMALSNCMKKWHHSKRNMQTNNQNTSIFTEPFQVQHKCSIPSNTWNCPYPGCKEESLRRGIHEAYWVSQPFGYFTSPLLEVCKTSYTRIQNQGVKPMTWCPQFLSLYRRRTEVIHLRTAVASETATLPMFSPLLGSVRENMRRGVRVPETLYDKNLELIQEPKPILRLWPLSGSLVPNYNSCSLFLVSWSKIIKEKKKEWNEINNEMKSSYSHQSFTSNQNRKWLVNSRGFTLSSSWLPRSGSVKEHAGVSNVCSRSGCNW